MPRGGPDGGDGGDGGSVVLVADAGETSLHPLSGFAEFAAGKGGAGEPGNRTGRRGADRVIRVPVGTVVHDAARGNVLADLAGPGDRVEIARGGRRGRGNKSFATPINRTPRQVEPGLPGEARHLRLVLKLIADVGLVGLPNAGKSTLLSVLSHARPKIAAYPFTTLEPALGIVQIAPGRSFVMADIPGLIEGAHEGRGLGHQFLRHIERTRVLLHLVDCSDTAEADPVTAIAVVRGELAAYSETLAARPWLACATKIESPIAEARADELERALGAPLLRISAVTRRGLRELVVEVASLLSASHG